MTVTSNSSTDRSIRPYISKIGILPSSLPAYHADFMEAKKNGKSAHSTSHPPESEQRHDHHQSHAEQAETARRLKPHSRSQLRLDESHKPAGMTPVPVKKVRPTKWQFGIRSRNQPLEAIGCIYRALQKLDAEWVVDEDYRPQDSDHENRFVCPQFDWMTLTRLETKMVVFPTTVMTMASLCTPQNDIANIEVERTVVAASDSPVSTHPSTMTCLLILGYFGFAGDKVECTLLEQFLQARHIHQRLTYVGSL